jgi:hypothetical protein
MLPLLAHAVIYNFIPMPNFPIQPNGIVSSTFLQLGLNHFDQAAEYVMTLRYARNSDKNNLLALFTEQCGTCSTKHALLKTLADEQGQTAFQLVIGMFKMNAHNTPPVAAVLNQYHLDYMPEAHCYLKHQGQMLDYTMPAFTDLSNDIMAERIIEADQIAAYKVQYHKDYLQQWLSEHPAIPYQLDQLWAIREQCIQALSEG